MGELILDSIQELLDWAPKIDLSKQAVIDELALAASEYIEEDVGYLIRSPSTAVTRIYDGDGEQVGGGSGELLYLGDRIQDLATLTVKENAKTLTVATGYTTTADVVARNVDGVLGQLLRRTVPVTGGGAVLVSQRRGVVGGWYPGIQNVEVTFLPGWKGDAADPVPRDFKRACVMLAWYWFERRNWVGIRSRSSAAGTTGFRDDIPEDVKAILDRRRRFRP